MGFVRYLWLSTIATVLAASLSAAPAHAQRGIEITVKQLREMRTEKRVALVIGNSNYPISPLANPVNDARLISETLQAQGSEVIERLDVGQKEMKRAVNEFGKRLEEARGDAVGLFYYAGHGVQVDGVNYLIPIDASI